MADLVCTLPQRLVYFATSKALPTEAVLRKQNKKCQVDFAAFRRLFRFVYRALHRIMKPSGCFVGLPVSRREPRCRCGGRRGGLNDSQHCAVGPGLQSPQRWSFPPASISLAVSLHSTRSSSSLSIQPVRYAETSIFSRLRTVVSEPNEGDYFLLP